MPTIAIEVSPAIEQAYQKLPAATRQQFDFELAFRLGQYSSESKHSNIAFMASMRRLQSVARQSGATETVVKDILTELGHEG